MSGGFEEGKPKLRLNVDGMPKCTHPPDVIPSKVLKKGVEKRKKERGREKSGRKKEKIRQQTHFCTNIFCNFNTPFVKSSNSVDFVGASRKDWSIHQVHFMFN